MSALCDKVHAFVDGELDDASAQAFQDHLARCESCPEELRAVLFMAHLELQLDADVLRRLVAAEGADAPDIAPVRDAGATPDARPGTGGARARADAIWGWKRIAIPLGIAALAAAALFLLWSRSRSHGPALAARVDLISHLDPTRHIEGRLSHPGATAHRPLERVRSGDDPVESIPPTVAAAFYEAGDFHGVATVALLDKNLAQAREMLDRAGRSPSVDSDRALLLLLSSQPERALVLTEAITERYPSHGAAWWNRALALEELGLPLVAAESFDRVADLDEPGWSDEARTRAETLRGDVARVAERYQRATELAARIVDGEREYDIELVAAHAGVFRKPLYLALSSAETRESVLGLAPLADALARAHGTDAPAKLVRRVAEADFSSRRAAVVAFRELEAGGSAVPAQRVAALLQEIRAAGADDILRIAMYQTGAYRTYPDEFAALVRASGDPWFEDLHDYLVASAQIARGELARAEGLLTAAVPRCAPPGRRAMCSRLLALLSKIHARESRIEPMQRHARRALQLARQDGDVPTESALLDVVGESVRLNMRLELSRAYRREALLRYPEHSCMDARAVSVALAWGYVSQGNVERGAAAMAGAARDCPPDPGKDVTGLDLQAANVYADLAAMTGDPAYAAAARDMLERVRTSPTATDGDRLKVLQLEGALALASDPARARDILETVIARADRDVSDPGTHTSRARALAFALLIEDAAARGAFADALALFEREARVGALSGCVLAASATPEEKRIRGVVRGADGAVSGFEATHDPRSPLAPDWIPTTALDALRPCSMVDVIARPPLPLSGALLPATVPWRLRMGRTRLAREDGTRPPLPPRRVVVHSVEPPPGLGLPRLEPWRPRAAGEDRDVPVVEIHGPAATPSRVLAALPEATEIEFHTHGLVDGAVSDASFLALAPDADGVFALTAGALRDIELRGHPIVTLGACHAGRSALYLHESWSLPLAFLDAGASLVIASQEPLPDADSAKFLAGIRARIRAGEEPARAVHLERLEWLNTDRGAWTKSVIVFE